ncbi:MAG: diacylglycerol kinase family lipid kinase [Elusimicrobia bacterium]|nr:diacylglycerol kinase family lipid kinase [Elusimicrobiota bacterium]
MKYTFILNSAAGTGRDPAVFETAVRSAFNGGGRPHRFQRTEGRGHGWELARRAVADGFDAVVAIGGDGTINEVARALVGTPAALGILPKGSGNGLAREFNIPLDPTAAARALPAYRPLAIDVGRVNGELFFNVAGFGLDARIARAFENSESGGRRGRWPYIKLGVREFLRYRPSPLTLHHDGGQTRVTPLLVALANGKQYGSGARIAPDAVVNDGLLDVVVVENAPWHRLLVAVPRIFAGTFRRASYLRTIRTQRLRVDFGEERPYHLDGEVRSGRSLVVDLLPRALNVLVPPEFAAAPPRVSRPGASTSHPNSTGGWENGGRPARPGEGRDAV